MKEKYFNVCFDFVSARKKLIIEMFYIRFQTFHENHIDLFIQLQIFILKRKLNMNVAGKLTKEH